MAIFLPRIRGVEMNLERSLNFTHPKARRTARVCCIRNGRRLDAEHADGFAVIHQFFCAATNSAVA
jgi:hypothetical protein